ncbi:type II toxin-antitoxin system HicA family toxin [Microbacterium sp. MYb62]|uniref:type II toxin-antitoxin system HicA family toxin n=1 Tax=Microbacterium sp. MYb62 TaxID=1848690 RepID=UPI000CFCB635|nr:type II toxin-antitoxin system HicA family toxin [Microbacterium sp. MYb62]PRB19182.1 hypothetical protein CQ042_01920 [Microbacterium sp. MYb62]
MVSEQPTRKIVKALRDAGFLPDRAVGSHTVWVNGGISISVPDGHKTISPGVVRKVNKAIEEATR